MMMSFITASLLLFSYTAMANQALFDAVKKNDEAEVIKILSTSSNVDVNFTYDSVKETPLMISASQGSLGIAKLLLEAGAKLNAETWTTKNAVYYASDAGRFEMMKFLIEKGGKFESLKTTENGYHAWSWTTLNHAVIQKDFSKLDYLLSLGADPNIWEMDNAGGTSTPLMTSAFWNSPEFVKRLLAAGAKVDFRIPGGGWCQQGPCSKTAPTAFEVAVANGSADAARVLIDAGADHNGHGEDGTYKFSIKDVVYKKQYDLAILFGEKKIGITTDNGMVDLGYRGEWEVIKRLHSLGIPLNGALGGAIQGKKMDIVKHLIAMNAPGIDASLFQVNSLEYYAANDYAELMLESGANPNYFNGDRTALYDAIIEPSTHYELVTTYIKHGGNINYVLPNKNTVLIGLLSCAFPNETLGKNCLSPQRTNWPTSIYTGVHFAENLITLGADPRLAGAEGKNTIDLLKLLEKRKCGRDEMCREMQLIVKKLLKKLRKKNL